MKEQFVRTAMLYGSGAVEKFGKSHVAVFGLGGVGGYVVEALVRSGVGALTLVDNDVVAASNLNRQVITTIENVGTAKTQAALARAKSINPACEIECVNCFFLPENSGKVDFSRFDYVVDAIDTVSGKIEIIRQTKRLGVPVISVMGAGNKLDPTRFEIDDIYNTSVCPLAKVMRKLCRENNIESLKVVYSREPALTPKKVDGFSSDVGKNGKSTPASNAVTPAVAGLIAASEVLLDLSNRSM